MTFYDHATNTGGAIPAHGAAIATARRTCLDEGTAYRVEANWKGQGTFYWNGCRYDVLGLAKTLVSNNAEKVVMTDPNGNEVDIKAARY